MRGQLRLAASKVSDLSIWALVLRSTNYSVITDGEVPAWHTFVRSIDQFNNYQWHEPCCKSFAIWIVKHSTLIFKVKQKYALSFYKRIYYSMHLHLICLSMLSVNPVKLWKTFDRWRRKFLIKPDITYTNDQAIRSLLCLWIPIVTNWEQFLNLCHFFSPLINCF